MRIDPGGNPYLPFEYWIYLRPCIGSDTRFGWRNVRPRQPLRLLSPLVRLVDGSATTDGTRTVFADSSQFPPNNGPIDLAFDRFGNLFASTESGLLSDPSNVIMKFTPNGVGTPFATDLDRYPRGLAFDRLGNLFVAQVGVDPNPGGNILKFTPNGVGTVFTMVPGGNNSGPEWLTFQFLPTPRPRPTPHPRPTQQF